MTACAIETTGTVRSPEHDGPDGTGPHVEAVAGTGIAEAVEAAGVLEAAEAAGVPEAAETGLPLEDTETDGGAEGAETFGIAGSTPYGAGEEPSGTAEGGSAPETGEVPEDGGSPLAGDGGAAGSVMTAAVAVAQPATVRRGFSVSADGAYAALLAGDGEALFPERWTLDGPEPYAVPLPLGRPEDHGTEVLPLADGRVLIRRRADGRHLFSLLYPTGPGTGELPLGGVESAELALLPPAPDGVRVYALAPGERSTAIWLVAGGAFGPEHVAEVPGYCSGGVWLDRTGRMLALDRRSAGGPVKAVAVDLERGGEVTPLLQITEDSDDRLVLAAPDSGLLLIRSNAPGQDRLGWGVLGSRRPVRFPGCLRPPGCEVTPFAVQPGQALLPESCAVALRIDTGAGGSALGVWRPSGRRLHRLAPPEGWFPGAGHWSREGVLRLPYTTPAVECGVARVDAAEVFRDEVPAAVAPSAQLPPGAAKVLVMYKPIPLQQAPLRGRTVPR
ncbi:hypothetical protein ACIBCM_01130 [Streptomyces sp. NPDC051018]|uniref:hypothetical protein n=1 Tax=Streptomyces sp. NPDC051018 TaxID=3365639 RepID=UPI0037A36734